MRAPEAIAWCVVAISAAAVVIVLILSILNASNVNNNNSTRIANQCISSGGTLIRNNNQNVWGCTR